MVTMPVDPKAEAGTPVSWQACLDATFGEALIEDYNCGFCGKNTIVKDRKRFISYPQVLAITLKRIVYTEYMPVKINADLVMDMNGQTDLTTFRGNNAELQDGELAIPESSMVEPKVDESMVKTLVDNGVPELAAKHAVYHNPASADMAIMWFYENIENPVIQTPLLVPRESQGGGGSEAAGASDANSMQVEMICSMGFTDK